MRMFCILALIFCLAVFLPSSTYAWETCETCTKTFPIAGVVSFTSSFCGCVDGDVITIQITPVDPTVVIQKVVFTKESPKRHTNQSWAEQVAVTPYTADVALHVLTDPTKTIHMRVYLSTGEHFEVVAHF
jgi:hypothetical protein